MGHLRAQLMTLAVAKKSPTSRRRTRCVYTQAGHHEANVGCMAKIRSRKWKKFQIFPRFAVGRWGTWKGLSRREVPLLFVDTRTQQHAHLPKWSAACECHPHTKHSLVYMRMVIRSNLQAMARDAHLQECQPSWMRWRHQYHSRRGWRWPPVRLNSCAL